MKNLYLKSNDSNKIKIPKKIFDYSFKNLFSKEIYDNKKFFLNLYKNNNSDDFSNHSNLSNNFTKKRNNFSFYLNPTLKKINFLNFKKVFLNNIKLNNFSTNNINNNNNIFNNSFINNSSNNNNDFKINVINNNKKDYLFNYFKKKNLNEKKNQNIIDLIMKRKKKNSEKIIFPIITLKKIKKQFFNKDVNINEIFVDYLPNNKKKLVNEKIINNFKIPLKNEFIAKEMKKKSEHNIIKNILNLKI